MHRSVAPLQEAEVTWSMTLPCVIMITPLTSMISILLSVSLGIMGLRNEGDGENIVMLGGRGVYPEERRC